MPVKDVDGGLTFQGFNPRILTDKLPRDQYVSKPFYFGGAQAPVALGLPPRSYSGAASCSSCRMRAVKKLPGIRRK